MSKISEISRQYHAALTASQSQYEEMYSDRARATTNFHRDFFHKLLCNFGTLFREDRVRASLQDLVERRLGTKNLQFVAIDGTCQREVFSDFVTFFGGAYGAKGELSLTDGSHQIRYKRWSLDHDVSMVAWIPIPFARLEEVTADNSEQFLVSEDERINLSAIHHQIMQLAEIYLAYNSITSSRLDAPNILLMDLSPSSVLASVARAQSSLGLIGYPYDRRSLTTADVTIATAHPFSLQLGVPSAKRMDLYRVIIAALAQAPAGPIEITELANQHHVTPNELARAADYLVNQGILRRSHSSQTQYMPVTRVDESWAYARELFQNLCTRLFIRKDPMALQYDVRDEHGVMRRRWMAPDDLGFLIGLGMRLLIEACWERNILFFGIAKDSASRYLTRNFLGVALETNFYPELSNLDIGMLPWTDRIFCETLPLVDESLVAPWATIEFDSAFMTLHRQRKPDSEQTFIAGVMGRIVNQERLFARSLAQFFLKRDKRTPLMGHVVFLERLLSPTWDRPGQRGGPEEIVIDTSELGRFSVFAWAYGEDFNPGQWVMVYLLSVLTRNHYAEAIGYPDPLHKADWGAKTIGRSVGQTIRSSALLMLSHPLSRTFRSIRDAGGR